MNLNVKKFNELSNIQLYEILSARSEIFIVEKKMNCQDMDGIDYKSEHFFFEEGSRVMAYLRAYYIDNAEEIIRFGRVLTRNHGIGLGRKIMEDSISYIKKNKKCKKIILNSQKQAKGFYEKLGFKVVSDEFLEEGILHVCMELEI